MRFDDKSSRRTLIKYLTDGMLLREAMLDPDLSQVWWPCYTHTHSLSLSLSRSSLSSTAW